MSQGPGTSSWSGRVLLRPDRCAYLGVAAATTLHAIHAFKVAVALEGELGVRDERGRAWRTSSLIVRPDQPHAIDGGGIPIAMFYVLPEAVDSVGAAARAAAPFARVPGPVERAVRARLRGSLDGAAAELDDLLGIVASALRPPAAASLDRRVAAVLEALMATDQRVSHEELARVARTSSSRLTHLFRDETGISLKRYRRWAHFRRGLLLLSGAGSLTGVAHAAGFADAAHFSRVFRGALGVTPSHLVRHTDIAVAPGPGTSEGGAHGTRRGE